MVFIEIIDEGPKGRLKEDNLNLKLPKQFDQAPAQWSKKQEAVIKVISYAEGWQTKRLMNYVGRVEKGKDDQETEEDTQGESEINTRDSSELLDQASEGGELQLEDQDGMTYKGGDQIKSLYEHWAADFGYRSHENPEQKRPTALMVDYAKSLRLPGNHTNDFFKTKAALLDYYKSNNEKVPTDLKNNLKRHSALRKQRDTMHMILSAHTKDNDPKSLRKVESAVREFLHNNYGKQGFEYAFVVHSDTEHPHAHVVLKMKNRETDKKLRLNSADLQIQRTEFARTLTAHGIEQYATRRTDRSYTLEKINKGLESFKQNSTWWQRKLEGKEDGVRNMAGITKRQVVQLERMKKLVNDSTKMSGKQKREAYREIRDLKKEVISTEKMDIPKQVDTTLEYIRMNDQDLGKKLESINTELQNTKNNASNISRAEKMKATRRINEQKKDLSNIAKRQLKQVPEIKAWLNHNTTGVVKTLAMKQINDYEKSLNALTLGKAKGR